MSEVPLVDNLGLVSAGAGGPYHSLCLGSKGGPRRMGVFL